MQFDSFEQSGLKTELIDGKEKLSTLHKGFESRLTPAYENFLSVNETAQEGIALWIGENAALSQQFVPGAMDAIKTMYSGMDIDGVKTLGIKEISEWNIHPDYKMQCIKQHAGDAAAVISTVKDNLLALKDGTGITTVRVADRPDLFPAYDYLVKIRLDSSGNIIERVQIIFAGKDAEGCLTKLKSKEFDKYFQDDKVDKIEIPKDYFDDVKLMIKGQEYELKKQITRLVVDKKENELLNKQKELERLIEIDEKIVKSTVPTEEATRSVINPELYINKIYRLRTIIKTNEAGIENAIDAATLSCAVSTIDNFQKFYKGEVTAQEAVIDIAKDTSDAATAGYETAFLTDTVTNAMRHSSYELIRKAGEGYLPISAVSWGVRSFDVIIDYAKGEVSGDELAYELGKNAANTAGGVIGGVAAGAAIGSVVPGAGTVVGAGVGIVGSLVGCAVASEAYVTAIEHGGEGAKVLASKAQELASDAVEIAKAEVPDKVNSIRDAINGFATENDVPIRV